MDINIRKAVGRDIPQIETITAEAYQKYIVVMGKKPAPMVADYAAHLANDIIYVVEDTKQNTIIGYAVIVVKDQEYWLETIAIAPDRSQQGIGTRLIRFVEDVIARSATEYQLYTNVNMLENIDWYQRLGFTEVRRERVDGYERVYFIKHLTQ
jgi:ribosomal protein S18 acetylase RimI-like enzyme